ncbi:PH domain-containing protein [Natronomonas sp. F2-12]|jgi:putative membrane protein|uniref:PH domain-containing protein n=1 Tax=Natronomonas aquatica TaxID=2841590 RepID=A0A9R1CSC6_9EURY|nr:PH domain-containing protein [Natronomonas aquatica]MCQ4334324.1 PH domain-containing protein [Natronomonas aquatica]
MKLDPLSVPVRAGESVVRLAWVLVVFLIGSPAVGGGVSGAAVLVAGWFLVAIAYQSVYYQRFEYELTDDTLDIVSGVVSRRNREIPLGRIQNVDISRNVLQRAVGIAQINLETAGGSSTEASLRYVSHEEAKRLQSELGRRKRVGSSDGAREEAPERELFSVTSKELVLLGVVGIDLRLLSVVTVLLPVVAPSLRERFADPLVGLAVTAPLAAVGIVAVTAVISGVLAVANYYGFRLSRREEELLYERGLLQRYSGSIPLEKIQTLTISENVIARRLGYASLAVETAGYAPGEAGSQSAVPLADRDRVFDLARSVESFEETEFERPPKRARERYLIRYSLLALLVVGGAFAADAYTRLTFAWYLTVALFPLAAVAAHLKWANLGYDVGSEYIVLREGFWTRTITVVPYYRVQTVLDSRTVFQRRRRLATLVVDTAGTSGLTNRQPRALDIDDGHAEELRELVADRLQEMVRRRRSHRRRERLRSIDAELPDEPPNPAT